MTRNEVIDLLSVITAFDRRFANREPSESDITAWLAAVGDLDCTDAQAAVVGHFRDTDAWLMPVHVRRRVNAIRADRIARAALGPPSEDPAVLDNPHAYLAAVRDQTRDAAAAPTARRAIGGSK